MEATFDWRTLGKADYSQAAALVASLPEEKRKCLDGVDRELTTRILHLSWTQGLRSGRGSGYCWPTLATLAKWTSRSVRTVERHIRKLASVGLVDWKQRAGADGKQTSNLYQMGKTFLASLFARGKKKVQRNQTLTKMSNNDLKREYKASAPIEKGERLTDFLEKLRAQRQPLASRQADEGARDTWGEDSYETRRRRELKFEPKPRLGPDGEEW